MYLLHILLRIITNTHAYNITYRGNEKCIDLTVIRVCVLLFLYVLKHNFG